MNGKTERMKNNDTTKLEGDEKEKTYIFILVFIINDRTEKNNNVVNV
jgi:hypothetical protein